MAQKKVEKEKPRDFLWQNLRELPYFRSLVRAVEGSFYAELSLPAPTLDIGCGDGHFASVAFERRLEVGIDPDFRSLQQASQRESYQTLVQSLGAGLPFPSEYFRSAISNSVLEHIPDVERVLVEIHRVMKTGAPFVFCVPNHTFLDQLSIAKLLDRLNLKTIARMYRQFFNRISRHYHSDSPSIWEKRLVDAGFELKKWWHYYPPDALRITEWGHYFGLPSLVSYILTKKWILVPNRWNLSLTEHLVRRHYYPHQPDEQGVYTFYVAIRTNREIA